MIKVTWIAKIKEIVDLVEELITFLSIFWPQKLCNLTAEQKSLNINLNAMRGISV